MTKANEIISFWFSEKCKKCWFDSSDELDELIKQNYEKLWQSAAQGDLDDWREQPMSALALVIILDQFPLNMYRDKAESFSTEDKSREIARYAIEKGFHESFADDQKLFLFLPFMHSEDMEDQNISVQLFSDAGMETKWAEHHRDIVKQFGRFPHRNAALGRKSTEQEITWLSSEEAFKG